MTFDYYPDTDTLYIALRKGSSASTDEVAPDVILDFDEDEQVIGITLEHASRQTDIRSIPGTSPPEA